MREPPPTKKRKPAKPTKTKAPAKKRKPVKAPIKKAPAKKRKPVKAKAPTKKAPTKKAPTKKRKPAKAKAPTKEAPAKKRKPIKAKRKPTKAPSLTPREQSESEIAAAQQRYSLRGMGEEMAAGGRVDYAVSVAKNHDGSVDGELRLFNIKRGYTIEALLIDLNGLLWGSPGREPDSPYALPLGHYISLNFLTDWGTRETYEEAYDRLLKAGFSPEQAAEEAKKIASPLPRYRGLGRLGMYPTQTASGDRTRSGNPKTIQMQMLNAIAVVRRQKNRRTKPQEVLVRAYWNFGEPLSPERVRRITGRRKREVLESLRRIMKRKNRGGG